MRLRNIFIGMLAFTMFLIIGCSSDVENIDSELPPTMKAVVMINGMEYPMEMGNYQWEIKKGLETEVTLTDHLSPYQMAEEIDPIKIEPNQKVEIRVEDNPDIKIYLWNENGRSEEIKQDNNQIIMSSSKGEYIYEALAEWPDGTISYTFVVDIK